MLKNATTETVTSTEPALRTVTTIDQFEQLRDAWDELTSEPLLSFAWHFSWWNSFQHLGQLQLFVLEANGQVVGIAPFFLDRWGGQRRLRFLGSGKTCTDFADLIVADGWRDRLVEEIAVHIVESMAMLELEGVTVDEPQKSFNQQLGSRFWRYDIELEPSWMLDLPDQWSDFMSGSKKSLKRKIKKAEKRLASDEFEIRTTLEDLPLDEGWKLLVELHQSRFQSKDMAGAFSDANFEQFLYDAVTMLDEKEQAEIVVAYHEGEPIGAHLILLGSSGPQLYQSGIQMAKAKSELGHLLITFEVRRAIEQGHSMFDFLRGNEPYKPYWGAVPHRLQSIRFVSRSAIPTMLNQGFCLLKKLKRKVATSKA